MSDVRSLLKAKRQELRVDHPSATYTPSGQLRCVVCETNIKHPSAWDGHLGSKTHRTNAARMREEERRRKEQELEEETKRFKRKVPEEDIGDDVTRDAGKRPRTTGTSPIHSSASNFPLDFFSDPLRAPLPLPHDSDDDEESADTLAITKAADTANPLLDQEWIQFQQSVINAPDSTAVYDHATIVAEPELVLDSIQGFPGQEVAPTQGIAKSDEDERQRKDQEERELIMDRLLDEERAQEEADMKVTVLKNRLEALRRRRDSSRPSKSRNAEVV